MEILDIPSFKTKVFDFEKSQTWSYIGALPAIIDFYADWCAPCRAQTPILEEISEEYRGRIQVYKINTESTPELAALFGVRGIPSLLFIPKSGEPAMSSGLMRKESLNQAISDLLGVTK